MDDETKAGILCAIWFVFFSAGLIAHNAVGYIIAFFATVLTVFIVYYDWRNEQTRKRLTRYTKDAGERIRKELADNGTRKDV